MINLLKEFEVKHTLFMARMYLLIGWTFISMNQTIFKHSHNSIYQLMYERGLIILTCNMLFFQNDYYPKGKTFILILQGAAFAISSPFFFLGLRYLPMAEGIIISQTNTIWSQVLAFLLLGERLSKIRFLNIGLSLIGIVMITDPFGHMAGMNMTHLFGCIMAFLSSVFQALSFIGVKMVGSGINPIVISQYFHGPLVVICGLCMLYMDYRPTYDQSYFLSLFGITCFTYLYTTFQYRAMSMVSYAKLAPFSFITVLNSVIIDYVVFGNVPNFLSALGGAVIIASMIISMKTQ